MNDPLSPLSLGSASSGALQDEVNHLRSLLQMTLVASLLATASIATYVFWQVRQLKREITGRAGTMAQMQQETPKMAGWIGQVKEFGRTHPDFREILVKYKLTDEPAMSPAPAAK